jgi:hypothetical protein
MGIDGDGRSGRHEGPRRPSCGRLRRFCFGERLDVTLDRGKGEGS